MSGFYLLHRGWMDHPVFGREEFTQRTAWVWLIENVAWKDTQHRIGGKLVPVRRGQIAITVRELAERWRWSKSRVDRFLKLLRDAGMIRAESGTEAARSKLIITLCNYEKYQALRDSDEPLGGTEAGQERDKNGTLKNEGNEETNSSDAHASDAAGAAQPEGGEKVIDLKARIFGPAREWLVARAGVTDQKARKLLGQWCRDYGDGATLQALQNAARASPEEPISWITGVLRGTAGKRFGQPFSTVEMLGDMADDDRSRRARAEADLTAPYYALPGA
jgi:hypothetical protein